MYVVIVIFHILACLALILIVLLQKGKGADLGAAFGGASQTVFGSKGAGGFLSRLTTAAAVIFMLTSLGLAYNSSHRSRETVMEEVGKDKTAKKAEAHEENAAPEGKAAATPQGNETVPAEETPSSPSVPAEQR